MSSLGDLIGDMWNEAGDSGSSSDHGFAFWEFILGVLKVIGILFGLLILFLIAIAVLEYFNIPVIEWIFAGPQS